MSASTLSRHDLVIYGSAVAIVLIPLFAILNLPDPFQLAIPITAFVVGALLRPLHAWVVALLAYLGLASTVVIVMATGHTLPKAVEGSGTSVGEIAFNTVMLAVYVAAVVLVPVWFGRRVGNRYRSQLHR